MKIIRSISLKRPGRNVVLSIELYIYNLTNIISSNLYLLQNPKSLFQMQQEFCYAMFKKKKQFSNIRISNILARTEDACAMKLLRGVWNSPSNSKFTLAGTYQYIERSLPLQSTAKFIRTEWTSTRQGRTAPNAFVHLSCVQDSRPSSPRRFIRDRSPVSW